MQLLSTIILIQLDWKLKTKNFSMPPVNSMRKILFLSAAKLIFWPPKNFLNSPIFYDKIYFHKCSHRQYKMSNI